MSNQQNQNSFPLILSALSLIAVSALCWFLIDQLLASTEVISAAISLMMKAGIALAVIVSLILIFNQLRGPARQRANNRKIEQIIEKASIDPEQTRSAIIRLRQILEPDQMKLAISLASLLEELLKTIEFINKEQQIQEQENLSLSQETSELKEIHDQLVKAPRLRSEFLSRMGDEITSPMKSLGSMIKLLNDMDLDHEARDLLGIASHSAYSLIENLTNILEFSKLDVHLLELEKQHFHVANTISAVLERQEGIALSKSLLIESHIKPDVPEVAFGDQKSVIKVLTNLLSNAIRFTSQGSIRVVVDNLTSDSNKLLRFTVIDTGVGIPESALKSLFDSLDKDTHLVDSSFTGRLRLIVSKQLCELMGGEIGVSSEQGLGSQFWFTIDISE